MLDQARNLSPSQIELDKIYLDPNNPRFATENSVHILDEDIDDADRQDNLIEKMEREHAVSKLKDSIESNGYLPIDRVVVRAFADDKYVVLEGNRRISAAKSLKEAHEENRLELEEDVYNSLLELPALIYNGEDKEAAWIFQGIRHISGVKDWSAFNKAYLLVRQMEQRDLRFGEAGKIFGISAYAAGQMSRAYYAYRQAKEHPDYQNDIGPELYSHLQELFGRSNIALKEWLEWDDEENEFTNDAHFSEFLSWYYPKLNNEGDPDMDQPGDWEERRISRVIDLRSLSKIVGNYRNLFYEFRQEGVSLNRLMAKVALIEEEQEESIETFLEELDDAVELLDNLPVVRILREDEDNEVLDRINTIGDLVEDLLELLGND